MTIAEMHVWFRQYAQQMGMQNVRAILPEQIDNLINTSTKDIIDEVINRNVGTTNDRVITDNAKLASINALRTLYRVKTLAIGDTNAISTYKNNPYTFNSFGLGEVLYFVDFSINYCDSYEGMSGKRAAYDTALIAYKTALDAYKASPTSENLSTLTTAANAVATAENNLKTAVEASSLTRWFPIRIIDDAYLADVLNDWVLAPRMRTPVMVIYSLISDDNLSTFEVYVGENLETGMEPIITGKHIGEIRCAYIKKPAEVKYLYDVGGENVNSDLPDQLQIPMLKHAVDLYRISIQGSLYANQQNAQQNQQELARNNARPDNEGYQS